MLVVGQEKETVKQSREKHENFIPQQSLKFQNLSPLSQKLIAQQNTFRQHGAAKCLPAWFYAVALVGSKGKTSLV